MGRQNNALSPVRWLLKLAGSSHQPGRILRIVDEVMRIPFMLILYTFFLRHGMVPAELAVNGYSSRFSIQSINVAVEQAANEYLRESSYSSARKTARYIKEAVGLQFIFDILDRNILIASIRSRTNKLYTVVAGILVALRAFFSLATQRIVITIASSIIAQYILHLLFTSAFLNAPLLSFMIPLAGPFILTFGLILSSIIVVAALNVSQAVRIAEDSWKLAWRRAINRAKSILTIIGKFILVLIPQSISLMLVSPEIQISLHLSENVWLLGDTVKFMEEFVYGANGQAGLGQMIIGGVEKGLNIQFLDAIYNPVAAFIGKPDMATNRVLEGLYAQRNLAAFQGEQEKPLK